MHLLEANKHDIFFYLFSWWLSFATVIDGSHISFHDHEKSKTSLSVTHCKTPNKVQGICIDLYLCDHILSLLRIKPLPSSIVSHIRKSVCRRKTPTPDVCCPLTQGKNGICHKLQFNTRRFASFLIDKLGWCS